MWNKYLNLFLFLVLNILAVNATDYHYNTSYFKVPIDHFGFASNHTFEIRYLTNDTYAKGGPNSPIFFYAGNEGDIELFAQNTGFMWDIAEEFNASLVFAEHRYYGKSMPFGNESLSSPKYSGYLTSEQALADFAKLLIDEINPKNRPVIAFGGSYGGMLAAWFRLKYPHLVRGAIASSAPVRQIKTECHRFYTIVSYVFHYKQGDCSENIRRTWDVIKKYASSENGRLELNTKFKFCNDLEMPGDGSQFSGYLQGIFANMAMVNYPYSTGFLAPLPPNPISEFCARFNGSYDDDNKLLDALQDAIQIYSNYTGQTKCLNIDSAYSPDLSDHGWYYQTCTEMIMPFCSKDVEKYNMFPPSEWSFKEHSDGCYMNFGVRPNKNMWIMNYGLDFKEASNIVFSNGQMDPWSSGGILEAPNDNIKVIIMPDTAHHLDLRAAHPDDPSSVIHARKEEKAAIREWISNQKKYVFPKKFFS